MATDDGYVHLSQRTYGSQNEPIVMYVALFDDIEGAGTTRADAIKSLEKNYELFTGTRKKFALPARRAA